MTIVDPHQEDLGSSSGMTRESSPLTRTWGAAAVRLHRMPASVRTRLPLVLGAALALEFWAELLFAVPADAPYRALAFVLVAVLAAATVEGRRHPLAGAL